MIVYTETLQLPLATDQIFSHLQNITVRPYRLHRCDYLCTYELQSLPNFQLMEGAVVPPHSDGIAGYRPFLILHNPSNNYTIRGVRQVCAPQVQSTLAILDIDTPHEVHSKDPNGRLGSWAGLVWGLSGQPLLKNQWSLQDTTEAAKREFLNFCHAIQETIHTTAPVVH